MTRPITTPLDSEAAATVLFRADLECLFAGGVFFAACTSAGDKRSFKRPYRVKAAVRRREVVQRQRNAVGALYMRHDCI